MMSNRRHLTEDELEELLMGLATPDLQAHCDGCASCSGRSAAFAASMKRFNRASLAWSEARSNTITRDLARHRPTWRLTLGAAQSLAATIVLGVMATVMAGTHLQLGRGSGPAFEATARPIVRGFASDARAQEIARDNAMLEAIDSELTQPQPVPAALFPAPPGNDMQRPLRQVQD